MPEEVIIPLEIKMVADNFLSSYKLLMENFQTNSNAGLVPGVVCLAFAVELYVKYLHSILRGTPVRGHNILELFRGLPKNIREEIRCNSSMKETISFYYAQRFLLYVPSDKEKSPINDIFEQQIYKISDSFERWRYCYETSSISYDSNFALSFVEAIKLVADQIYSKSISIVGEENA